MNGAHNGSQFGLSVQKASFRPLASISLLIGLLLVAALVSGCSVQPIVAGPLRQAPLPGDQGPIIAVAPIAAASGETVSVSGAGWAPLEVIFINLEGDQDGESVQATLATGTTDADGRFFLAFVTPLDFFWQNVVDTQIVAYSLNSGQSASVPFELLSNAAVATLTPTRVMTPTTATPTPTRPSSSAGYGVATVTSRGLNMRTGPGTVYPVVRSLVQGTPITVLGQDASGLWLYGQLADGVLGWVARAYTNYSGAPPIVPAPPTPVYRPPATPTPLPTALPGLGWQGEYYTNPSLQGTPRVVREESAINFNWGFSAPAPGIPATGFSARWFRTLYFSEGVYRLFGQSDGGVRIWVDNRLVLDQWSGVNGAYSVDVWLNQGSHTFFVDYGQRRQPAQMTFWWELTGATPSPGFPEWRGEYFNNRELTGAPVHVRNDQNIDFNWSWISPAPGLGAENYSVRWTRTLDFATGDYRFYIRSDDGNRVFVDGARIIDEWRDMSGGTTYTADRRLSGQHTIVVEYYQHTGPAFVHFWWERIQAPTPTRTPTRTPTPQVRNPYADANPSSGVIGTQVDVTFGGFPANTTVNLYLGGYVRAADAANSTVYASGASDRFGNGSLRFTVPATWPDGAPLQPGKLALLVATNNFGVSAAAEFDVTAPRPTVAPNPYVDINPVAGGPGTQVSVRGGGYPANRTINIYLGAVVRTSAADASPVVTTSSDGNGNFSTAFTMPGAWPDGSAINTGKLVVLAATSDFAVQNSATFDFFVTPPNPSISLSPTAGGAGTRVTAAGGGFPANAQVAVFLAPLDAAPGRGALQQYVAGTADRNGRYSLSFTMPGAWPDGGQITQDRIVVTVATPDFSVSVSSIFAYLSAGPTATSTPSPTPTNTPPVAPTLAPNPSAQVSPGSGAAGTTVTVSGGGFPPNTMLYAHLAQLGGSPGSGNNYAGYASAPSDGAGNYVMVFVMPATWPNGSAIATQRLVILVATADFSAEASTTFSYQQVASAGDPAPSPTATEPPPPTATNTPEPPTATPAPAATATNTPAPPAEMPTPSGGADAPPSVEPPVAPPIEPSPPAS